MQLLMEEKGYEAMGRKVLTGWSGLRPGVKVEKVHCNVHDARVLGSFCHALEMHLLVEGDSWGGADCDDGVVQTAAMLVSLAWNFPALLWRRLNHGGALSRNSILDA